MSIRPVDYTNLISKSQEVAKIKQIENDKIKVQIEQGAMMQEKQIKQNIGKVRDTNKSENRIVDDNKKNQNTNKRNDKEKKRKKEKKKSTIVKNQLGGTIDIKI